MYALLVTGCATTAPAPKAAPTFSARSEVAEFKRALEEARDEIVARGSGRTVPPLADSDAMVSMPIPGHQSIAGALRLFSTDLRASVQQSLDRSAGYKKLIDSVLDEYKLPRALGYLPVIESAYLPTLTSRAGAYGIWQFMIQTAREYGLRVDWWVDERASPERSTRAAAAYLRDLHREFGDWPLTLAAYNAGPGRIRRALASSGASTFWELSERGVIPKETRGYVPTFFATVLIVGNPAMHGFVLSPPEEVDARAVQIEGPVSLEFVSQKAELEEPLLRALNPELRQGIVPPGSSVLQVPARAREQITAHATSMKGDDPLVAASPFTLRDGDTLDNLCKTLGVRAADVLDMNGLSRKDFASTGRTLYLPVRRSELSSLLRIDRPEDRIHEVEAGDTLWSIATGNGLTVDELRDLNQLADDHILHPGERLRISANDAVQAGM